MAVSVIEASGTVSSNLSVTAEEGFTISNIVAVKHKTVLQIIFLVKRNVETAANATITIGTLGSEYRPRVNAGVVSPSFRGVIGIDGKIYLRPFTTIPANNLEAVCAIFLI